MSSGAAAGTGDERVVEVRPERPADGPAIAAVHTLAFGRVAEARLVEELRPTDAFVPALALVALVDDAVVGHALFSRVTVETAARPVAALALGPIGVRPEWQCQGVGTALIRHGLAEARRLGHRLVVLIGHPDYYPRFGFAPARAQGLATTYPVPDAAFMALDLQPTAPDRPRGLVRYPLAFDGV